MTPPATVVLSVSPWVSNCWCSISSVESSVFQHFFSSLALFCRVLQRTGMLQNKDLNFLKSHLIGVMLGEI